MDDILPILFGLLVFLGPLLLKLIGSVFEGAASSDSSPKRLSPEQRRALQERARQHRAQQESMAVDAEIVEAHHSVFDQSGGLSSIDQRDDRMDSHLEQKFEHSVGTLSGESVNHVQEDVLHTEELVELPSENLAAGIKAMMKSPADVRKAFILGEILQRPS